MEGFVRFLELLEELPLVEGRSEEVKLIPESTFRPLRCPSEDSAKCWQPVTSEHSLIMLLAKSRYLSIMHLATGQPVLSSGRLSCSMTCFNTCTPFFSKEQI